MRNRGGLKMLSLQADWIHPLRRRGLWSVGRWFGRRGFHNVRLSLHIHFRKRQTVQNRWSGFRMTVFVILQTRSSRLFSKNNSIRMRISLPAYRKPAPGCGRTSITAKKTFSSRPRQRRGWSVIRIGQSQDGNLLRLKRSIGCVPGAALESQTLPPDEQQNDSDAAPSGRSWSGAGRRDPSAYPHLSLHCHR